MLSYLKKHYIEILILILKIFSDIPDYWPELGDDLTDVKWSHATNSQRELADALNGN